MRGEDRLLPPPRLRLTPSVDHRLMFLQGMSSILLISVMGSCSSTSSATAFSFSYNEQLLYGPLFKERSPTDDLPDQEQDSSSPSFLHDNDPLSPQSNIPESSYYLTARSARRGFFTSKEEGLGGRCSSLGGCPMRAMSSGVRGWRLDLRAMLWMRLLMPLGWFQMVARSLSFWEALGLAARQWLRVAMKARYLLSRCWREKKYSEGSLCIDSSMSI